MEGVQPTINMGQTRWYKKPTAEFTYAVALDPSMGTGGDFAAIQVFELPTFEQIGEWQHNQTPMNQQVRILQGINKHIHDTIMEQDASASPQIFYSMENNAIGEAALLRVMDIGEENIQGMFLSEPIRKGHRRKFRRGFNTTAKHKIDACTKFKELVEHIVENSIRVVNLSMGSKKIQDWECFEKVASKYKDVIFVVSAGNNGFNIDENPIYPASLNLKNILAVTSSDKSGRLGRGSNYGQNSVDFILPAERLQVYDHRGVKAFTGGTSYAAPRLTALISRYIEKNPNCTNDEIYDFLKKRAIQKGKKITKYGWIPDPLDNYLIN